MDHDDVSRRSRINSTSRRSEGEPPPPHRCRLWRDSPRTRAKRILLVTSNSRISTSEHGMPLKTINSLRERDREREGGTVRFGAFALRCDLSRPRSSRSDFDSNILLDTNASSHRQQCFPPLPLSANHQERERYIAAALRKKKRCENVNVKERKREIEIEAMVLRHNTNVYDFSTRKYYIL